MGNIYRALSGQGPARQSCWKNSIASGQKYVACSLEVYCNDFAERCKDSVARFQSVDVLKIVVLGLSSLHNFALNIT